MWSKIKKYIALLLLMLTINQSFAQGQGVGCWFGDLKHILSNSHTSNFEKIVTAKGGFERFRELREVAKSRGLNNAELLQFSRDVAKVTNPNEYINAIKNNPNLINSWKTLYNVGHDSRLNITLLYKISKLNPELQKRVGNLYKFLKAPKGYSKKINYSVKKNIDGKTIIVRYDNNGFPDFTPFIPGLGFVFKSNSLTGLGIDMTAANKWVRENFSLTNYKIETLPGGKIRINGVDHTWHHHQDGKTMFPIPSSIHNTTGGFGGYPHSGGAAVIKRELQGEDLFDSPIFQ